MIATLTMPFAMALALSLNPVAVPGMKVEPNMAARTYALALSVQPRRNPLGKPVAYSLSYKNLPKDAVVYVFLERDVPERESLRYHGDVGSIVMRGFPGPAQRSRLTWDGRHVTCAPTDFVKLCDKITPGRYRLTATIFSRPISLGGLPPPRPYANPPIRLAAVDSAPFEITGAPPLALDDYAFRTLLLDHISTFAGATILRASTQTSPFLSTGRFTAAGSHSCGAYDLKAPFAGTLTACTPEGSLTNAGMKNALNLQGVTVTGKISYASGLTYSMARDRAFALADASYLTRAPLHADDAAAGPLSKRGTYLAHKVVDWGYANRAWLFSIHEGEAGGTVSRRFSDIVMVRVEEGARSCIVGTWRYDIFWKFRSREPTHSCPK